jgi:hypothetical protein
MSIRTLAVCLTLFGLVAPAVRAADPSVDSKLEKVLRDLTVPYEKDPTASWRAVPDDFKKEIEAVFADLLKKMDPELWDKSFAVLRKTLKVLKDKREIVLDLVPANLPGGLDKKSFAELYDAEIEALNVLVTSDLAKLETARKLDLEKFRADMASKTSKQVPVIQKALLKSPLAQATSKATQIPGSKVASVKVNDDEAVVTFKPAEGEAFEVTFAKFGGKWYPKEEGEMLAEGLPKVKQLLAGIDADTIKTVKPMVLQALGKVDSGLDKLAATTTAAEFSRAIAELVSELAGGGGFPPNQ